MSTDQFNPLRKFNIANMNCDLYNGLRMKKKILITGAAGFIGFHLARYLTMRGNFVIGIDNFNHSYDPTIKFDRAKQLNIEIQNVDICDTEKLKKLIEEHQITHFINLAAQAGVRRSLTHPNDFIQSNLQGFGSVLEAIRSFPHVKLVYASSSSVYGMNKKIPFAESDPTDHPANLYGATKKANEVMAFSYHQLYGICATGLRYFTVYGPWGRPDMAIYHFSKQITENKPIQIFNEGKMVRDFTYIDDIILGTVAAIDLESKFEIFNLGNHKPVDLIHLIQLLEEQLNTSAIKEFLPMQKGEVTQTFADIEKSQKILHFNPKISIEEGIKKFIHWFKDYHLTKNENASGKNEMRSWAVYP